MSKVAKIAYKPIGIGGSLLAATVASAAFKQVWRRVAHKDDAPDALQSEYSLSEVLLAAAIQGLIFAVIKALVERGGAKVFEKLTGAWPGS
jgi:NO-binding membrane sensor protein with MHYT domain